MSALVCVLAVWSGMAASEDGVKAKAVVLRPIHDVKIPAQETGPLVQLAVEEGQSVEQGQLLARVDDSDASSAVAEAIADFEVASVEAESELAIESAQNEFEAAAKKVQSAEESNAEYQKKQGSRSAANPLVTVFAMNELRLAETQAKLALSSAKLAKQKAEKAASVKSERVKRARERLARHTVTSPVSGSVVESKFERGEWVEAGQVVARVIQTKRLKAEGLIDPDQVTSDMVGSPVTISVRIGQQLRTLRGTLTFVSAEAHPKAHTVRVRAVVENPGQLVLPGVKGCSLTIHPRTAAKPLGSNR